MRNIGGRDTIVYSKGYPDFTPFARQKMGK
jgi:hypothetical protein